MQALKRFFWTMVLGGLGVLLPIFLFSFLVQWLYRTLTGLIEPLTKLAVDQGIHIEWLADLTVIGGILTLCFLVGFLVRTRSGSWLHRTVEARLLDRFPGYSIIRETVTQFIGQKKSPFSQVALVQVFGNETLVTGFVTDDSHADLVTVFVPTGPNPTSGNICHIRRELVHYVDTPVEKAMRTIISCGAGSAGMLDSRVSKDDEG